MKTVAVDFDGVIHAYSLGWHDGTIYDEPVPGALDALKTLLETYAVVVFTTRDIVPVAAWLALKGFHVAPVRELSPPFWREKGIICVTSTKPAAAAYIDDRGIRFHNWVQALAMLECYA